MALTRLTRSVQRGLRPTKFRLDLTDACLFYADKRLRLTDKAFDFIGVLTLARLLERSGHRGWVEAQEISTLPSWTSSKRLQASLNAQIRREIKRLEHKGLDVIETQPNRRLKGPFHLKVFPQKNVSDLDRLLERFAPSAILKDPTPEGLFRWLEAAQPVWNTAYSFDKDNTVLSRGLGLTLTDDRVLAVMTLIAQSRRLREMGEFRTAHNRLNRALSTLKMEGNTQIRTHLEGSCYVQQGWLAYRLERWKDAETAAEAALTCVEAHGHLTVRGQALSLRSLLHRRRRRFAEAVQDLWLASECWLVEVDLYNLFSVYHNLSCVLSDQATYEKSYERQQELLEQAIEYCKKSKEYCQRYHVAQNSVINRIQLASLYARVDNIPEATREADEAFKHARKVGNRTEAFLAYGYRVKLRLRVRNFSEADEIHRKFLEDLATHPERHHINERYQALRRDADSNIPNPNSFHRDARR